MTHRVIRFTFSHCGARSRRRAGVVQRRLFERLHPRLAALLLLRVEPPYPVLELAPLLSRHSLGIFSSTYPPRCDLHPPIVFLIPHVVRAAGRAMRRHVPLLPPLTSVLVHLLQGRVMSVRALHEYLMLPLGALVVPVERLPVCCALLLHDLPTRRRSSPGKRFLCGAEIGLELRRS